MGPGRMKVVGRRVSPGNPFVSGEWDGFVELAEVFRLEKRSIPRGVYRFKSRGEALWQHAGGRLPRKEDLRRIFAALEHFGVEYVLVGAVAAGLQGRPRMAHGVELLVDPSSQNVEKIKAALAVLGGSDVQELKADDLEAYAVVRVACEIVVDLSARIGSVTTKNAGVQIVELEGVAVRVADVATLARWDPFFMTAVLGVKLSCSEGWGVLFLPGQ